VRRVLDAGSTIAGKYRLERLLGKGGMGAVWRATHVALSRAVAVKFVLEHAGVAPRPETLERFMREARSAAAVRHRNVVDVLDYGEHEGRPYLVMECLDGESLGERLDRAPPPSVEEILDWFSGALGGLAAIHDAGLVHRDLKPANVFLARDADGVIVKVLDFGIARQTEGDAATLTHSMQTLGTPHYMSPEQVRSAKNVDARSDVYAIGVMLYQALAGRLPFDGPSAPAIIAAIVTDDPIPLAEARGDVPRALAALVHRAMARDPGRRFESARAMRAALRDALRADADAGAGAEARAGAGGGAGAGRGGDGGGAGAGRGGSGSGGSVDDAVAETVASGDRRGERAHDAAAEGRGGRGVGSAHVPGAGSRAVSTSGPADPASRSARARTGRRGFLGIFGVLSTLLVVSIAGIASTRTSLDGSGSVASAPAPPTAGGGAIPAGGGGPPGAIADGLAITGAPAVEGATASGPFVSAPASLASLAIAWREMPPELRECVALTPDADRWIVHAVASCAARAPELIAAFGAAGPARPGAPDAGALAASLSPLVMGTNTRSNVRTGPGLSHDLTDSIPDGTLVVALRGTFGGEESHAGGRGTWTRAVIADGVEGWIASTLLAPWTHCMPRADAIGGGHVIASHTRIVEGDHERDALVLLELRGDREDRRSRVRIAPIDEQCGIQRTIHIPRGNEPIEDLFVTRIAPEGETLLLIGTRDPGPRATEGRIRWAAWRLGGEAPAWELTLRTGQWVPESRRDGISGPFREGPGAERGFWPVRTRVAEEGRTWWRWDGATLVADRVESRGPTRR
jgi:hypothetical protein